MSTANFIKFYTEHLPKHPELKASVENAETPKLFAAALMEQGHKAGFEFSEDDVEQVLVASINQHGKGELNENQLDGVVGGAGGGGARVPTIQVAPVKSLVNISPAAKAGNSANTVMCPGWSAPGTQAANPAAIKAAH